MPRKKSATQKAKAAALKPVANDPKLLHHRNTADGQPKQKKAKTNESLPHVEQKATTLPKPPQPKSVAGNVPILPPEADDVKLRAAHEIHGIAVMPNSKMETKIDQVLQAIQTPAQDGKTVIVALTAPAKAANKCVGVAEIVKRELSKEKISTKIFQYTGCWMRLESQENHQRSSRGTELRTAREAAAGALISGPDRLPDHIDTKDQIGEDEDSDDVFEGGEMIEKKRVRDATCLVIYLSRNSVARLHELYGEQVHNLEKG